MKFTEYSKIIPDAFHGTRLVDAESILEQGEFAFEKNPDHYLGDGVYFVEGAEQFALDYAERKFPGVPVAVIRAVVTLVRCLDLHIPEHVAAVKKAQVLLAQRTRGNVSDAAAINSAAAIIRAHVVRSPFVRKGRKGPSKIFPGSRIYKDSFIYLCVRDQEAILTLMLSCKVDGD